MANRILSMLWKIFNYTRKVIFGLLAIVLLVLLVVALVATRGPKVQSSTILVLRIEGNLVEELSSDAVARVVRPAVGQEQKETLVWDVTDALREAKDDRRVKAVLLDLNHMGDALSFDAWWSASPIAQR